MFRRTRLACAAVIMFAAAACSYGSPYNAEQVPNLKPGVTTYNDAVALLGQPVAQRTSSKDGVTKVAWSYMTTGGTPNHNKLVLTFRTQDMVLENVESQTMTMPRG